MNIRKVEVHGVGPLLDIEIELKPKGTNLILGPNECGKSTLYKSIISIVYGFSTKVEAQQSRSRGESGRFCGKIVVDIGDVSYEISREFDLDDVTVVRHSADFDPEVIFDGNANPRGRTEEPHEYRRILRDEIGFPSKSVLCNTAFVGQLDVGIDLDDDLRRQISGAGQADYKKARQIMRDQYYDLSREALPGDNRRRVDKRTEKLTQEIDTLEMELNQAIEGGESINRLRMENESKKGEFLKVSENLTNKNRDVEALEQHLGYVERFNSYKHQESLEESRQNQLSQLKDRIARIEKELASESYTSFADLENDDLEQIRKYINSDVDEALAQIEKIINYEQRVQDEIDDDRFNVLRDAHEDTGQKLLRLKELDTEISEQREKIRKQDSTIEKKARKALWLIPFVLFVVGGVIGGLLGNLVIGFSNLSINPVLGVFIGFGMFGIALGFVGLIIALSLRNQPDVMKLDLIAAETRLADARSERDETTKKLKSILEEDNSLDVLIERWINLKRLRDEKDGYTREREQFESRKILEVRENPRLTTIIESKSTVILKERLKKYEELGAEMATKQDILAGLSATGNDSVEDISSQLKEVQRQLETLEDRFPTFKDYRENSSQGVDRLEREKRELERLEERSKELSIQVRKAELDLAGFRSPNSGNPEGIEEQLEQKREELDRCILLRDALAIAIETLDEAIIDFEEKHILHLSSKTSQYFKLFSREHYVEVSLDANGIFVTDNLDRNFDVTDLSTGARDQLFIALRIAITDLLSADSSVPIIMDDSFVNFDPVRLVAALDFMTQIGLERQVILLTHDGNYEKWADRVITMNNC